ncbi:MAG: Alpha/beta hydrolase [Frankiales bacterium]|nr:Alpha/beta hydrolase [Frankiales bacterium]
MVACTSKSQQSQPAPAKTVTTTPATTPAPSSTSTAVARPTIQFSDCTGQFRTAIDNSRTKSLEFSCGKLNVPLDYARPTGQQVSLFVLKIHDTEQQPTNRLGSLLVNPGGPGASGVNLAAGLVTSIDQDVLTRFDLVGFDPRGVALSSPVTCITDKQKDQLAGLDPDVRTAAGRATAKAAAAAVVKECKARYGAALAHFNTEETARDLDLLRQALGDDKLNYLGFSYGTRLGAAYAHLFPTKIRVAVLDGALEPQTPELTVDERQAQGFEQAFDQFAADCQRRAACQDLGKPRATVTALVSAADKSPIKSSLPQETRRATGGIVLIAVAEALYNSSAWPELASALIDAKDGDSRGLFALADSYYGRDSSTGHYSNLVDSNWAINCNDSRLKITDALVAAKAREWIAKYPLFGANMAATLYNCLGWPASGHPLPPAGAVGAPPLLVIGTLHDPATPFSATGLLARAVGSGVVLSRDGEGHTAYGRSSCITTKVNSYLFTGAVPAGHSCPAS